MALALLLIVLMAADGAAQTTESRPDTKRDRPAPLDSSIAECVEYVRQRIRLSQFDAYIVPATKNLRTFGTEEDHFQFDKCLALKGIEDAWGGRAPRPNR